MAIHLVEDNTSHDGTKGQVCFESDIVNNFSNAITELSSGATRNEAIKVAAAKGLPDPRVELSISPYPIDVHGEPVVRPTEQQIHRYRVDVAVTRRLV